MTRFLSENMVIALKEIEISAEEWNSKDFTQRKELVKKQYKATMKKAHPDRNGIGEKAQTIAGAFGSNGSFSDDNYYLSIETSPDVTSKHGADQKKASFERDNKPTTPQNTSRYKAASTFSMSYEDYERQEQEELIKKENKRVKKAREYLQPLLNIISDTTKSIDERTEAFMGLVALLSSHPGANETEKCQVDTGKRKETRVYDGTSDYYGQSNYILRHDPIYTTGTRLTEKAEIAKQKNALAALLLNYINEYDLLPMKNLALFIINNDGILSYSKSISAFIKLMPKLQRRIVEGLATITQVSPEKLKFFAALRNDKNFSSELARVLEIRRGVNQKSVALQLKNHPYPSILSTLYTGLFGGEKATEPPEVTPSKTPSNKI
jgi:hypothetical protein